MSKKIREAEEKRAAEVGLTTSSEGTGDITNSGQNFQQVEIEVEDTTPTEVQQLGVEESEEGIDEEIPEDIDLESFKLIFRSGANLPSLYFGDWAVRTPEHCDVFATEIWRYCNLKGINIRDYLFEEFPLIIAGAHFAGGFYKDYKKFKEEEKETPEEKANKKRRPGDREPEVEEKVDTAPTGTL